MSDLEKVCIRKAWELIFSLRWAIYVDQVFKWESSVYRVAPHSPAWLECHAGLAHFSARLGRGWPVKKLVKRTGPTGPTGTLQLCKSGRSQVLGRTINENETWSWTEKLDFKPISYHVQAAKVKAIIEASS